jgi:hypothetical protein
VIHYHGTPVSGTRIEAARFLAGRHALVPFTNTADIAVAAEVCQSFVLDNGAFSVWKSGKVLDVPGFYAFVDEWRRHPGFDWALIPDVIDGDEAENDTLLADWPFGLSGVPVWHMHESIERLELLAAVWPVVAIGSSGEFRSPGTASWWARIGEAMARVCDAEGRPPCKFHGLRMLNPAIFSRLPLASADSTNATMNAGNLSRFGMYKAPNAGTRAHVIAERIEAHNSAAVWAR